ncbi:MAG TPA: hypothetical protein VLS49_11260 [Usitatibacter sp.]|nr:hypothetical protein [Usitatibacter sp.]
MSRFLLAALLVAACAGWSSAARAETKTVCTVTVNSADEKEAMRRHLPPGRYRFVELLERHRDDWLGRACHRHVQCDVLVISGHFNAGETFYSDKVDVEASLKMDELERASCSHSCPPLFAKLKEVYLFGCESLNPHATQYSSAYGESGRDRMRRVFAGVPVIYGFSSHAPVGPTAAMLLDRYFAAGGASEVGSGRPSAKLLRIFGRNSLTAIRGALPSDAGAAERREICEFFDERESPAAKLRYIHEMLRRDPERGRKYLARLETLLASLDGAQKASAAFQSALAGYAADEGTRDRFLAIARGARPYAVRARMLAVAAKLAWLEPGELRAERIALLDDMLASRTMGFAEVDLGCAMTAGDSLAGALAQVRLPAASPHPVADAALLACMGSGEARARVLRALASADEKEAELAQLYLQHRPLADGPELRSLAAEVTRMPPSAAQLRALGALARLHIADRGILDELARAFAETKSVEVQRAIAEVFMRSDPEALPKPELVGVLRRHRLRSPDGHPDLIDSLISSLDPRSAS